jgi:hypothetical protein
VFGVGNDRRDAKAVEVRVEVDVSGYVVSEVTGREPDKIHR